MGYTKSEFGISKDGEKVYRYMLTNDQGASASFTDLGGIWLSMIVPDKNGEMADVLLGYDSVEHIQSDSGHLGEIVGRNCNRIGGATFSINGRTYELDKNDHGMNNLHSGPAFYRDRVWFASVSEEDLGTQISFSLESPDGDQGFPGNANITVSYTLTPDNSIQIDYSMLCDEDTVANFTNHAYFNLSGHDSGDILDTEVWIDADEYTIADEYQITTGEIAPVKGTPMDFTEFKALGRDIDMDFDALNYGNGYDSNWVLNHPEGELSFCAKAVDKKSGRTLEVYTDLPGLQLYTANSLDTEHGKDGTAYHMRSGFCFETQYFPNAVNYPQFVSPILEAGEEYQTTTIYKFGIVEE